MRLHSIPISVDKYAGLVPLLAYGLLPEVGIADCLVAVLLIG